MLHNNMVTELVVGGIVCTNLRPYGHNITTTHLLDATFETKAEKFTLFVIPFRCERVLHIRAVQPQGVPHTSGSFEIGLC